MLSRDARRVLLVDDDLAIHRTVATMLEGFELCSAYDGPGAVLEIEVALAQHAELALVILDVAMPGWDGLTTLEHIWRLAPDTQAVFCTGAALDHRELAARFGDTDAILVVPKPFSRSELAQAAHTLASKWQLQRAVRARVDELEAAVGARTSQLEAANTRLAEQLAWRDRVEAEVRLSQRLEAIGQLASGIAHEINNPLQYVGDHLEFVTDSTADLLGLVGRVRDCVVDQGDAPGATAVRAVFDSIDIPYMARELPGALEAIQGGIQRITSIVRAMKELAHPGTRDPRVADINRALDSALEISATAYRGVAELDKQLSPLPPVPCFIAELGQVFLNLIVNAAHAMEGRVRGKLVVKSWVDGKDVAISISDTGAGIPPEIQARIFDPFFTTKAVGRGTGQGLAIARSIVVEHHGGSLVFDSVTDCGTTFTIRIPVAGPVQHQATVAA
jgi:signal transduction histidine kinase